MENFRGCTQCCPPPLGTVRIINDSRLHTHHTDHMVSILGVTMGDSRYLPVYELNWYGFPWDPGNWRIVKNLMWAFVNMEQAMDQKPRLHYINLPSAKLRMTTIGNLFSAFDTDKRTTAAEVVHCLGAPCPWPPSGPSDRKSPMPSHQPPKDGLSMQTNYLRTQTTCPSVHLLQLRGHTMLPSEDTMDQSASWDEELLPPQHLARNQLRVFLVWPATVFS